MKSGGTNYDRAAAGWTRSTFGTAGAFFGCSVPADFARTAERVFPAGLADLPDRFRRPLPDLALASALASLCLAFCRRAAASSARCRNWFDSFLSSFSRFLSNLNFFLARRESVRAAVNFRDAA